jgi:DNA-directed RNA polymerase specialized sigma subunit
MKKYNVKNYIRYKEDIKQAQPPGKFFDEYTRDELIVKFTPLVENIARKVCNKSRSFRCIIYNGLNTTWKYWFNISC